MSWGWEGLAHWRVKTAWPAFKLLAQPKRSAERRGGGGESLPTQGGGGWIQEETDRVHVEQLLDWQTCCREDRCWHFLRYLHIIVSFFRDFLLNKSRWIRMCPLSSATSFKLRHLSNSTAQLTINRTFERRVLSSFCIPVIRPIRSGKLELLCVFLVKQMWKRQWNWSASCPLEAFQFDSSSSKYRYLSGRQWERNGLHVARLPHLACSLLLQFFGR